MFLFPILQCTCFYLAIGDNPKSLSIGIVNDELSDYRTCFNKSLITTTVDGDECYFNKISCRYLSKIPPELADQVYFDSVEEAYAEARHAHIIGYIHFAENYTESVADIHEKGQKIDDGTIETAAILIRLDNSNQQVSYFVERKLREIYGDFSKELMTDCQRPEKLGTLPVRFEKPIYGSFDAEFKQYAAPGVVMT